MRRDPLCVGTEKRVCVKDECTLENRTHRGQGESVSCEPDSRIASSFVGLLLAGLHVQLLLCPSWQMLAHWLSRLGLSGEEFIQTRDTVSKIQIPLVGIKDPESP
jgi:hypothetical protein